VALVLGMGVLHAEYNHLQVTASWLLWLDDQGMIEMRGLPIGPAQVVQRSQATLLQSLHSPLFVALAANHDHLLALRADGSVYGFGDNALGGLGQSVSEHRRPPDLLNPDPDERFFSRWVERARLVYGMLGARQVALGGGHSLALLEDGALCAWGFNDVGQLGAKLSRPFALRLVPWKVAGLPPLAAAAAGDGHSLALDTQGRVLGWGLNNMGQLGDGTRDNRYRPRLIAGLNAVTAIAAGAGHSLALDRQGQVWSWGENSFGELGRPTGRHRFARRPLRVLGLPPSVRVVAAGHLSAALDTAGGVWWWGIGLRHVTKNTLWRVHRVAGIGPVAQLALHEGGMALQERATGRVWLLSPPYDDPHNTPQPVLTAGY
jgi:alpha-tubulin suppressor-like RCC1 family protein